MTWEEIDKTLRDRLTILRRGATDCVGSPGKVSPPRILFYREPSPQTVIVEEVNLTQEEYTAAVAYFRCGELC